ncbi:MAG: CHAT domain-containing protein [Bacteroidetes bacterium]|nr:CHAT domain-containing protein [Bacteroidota bacterium]
MIDRVLLLFLFFVSTPLPTQAQGPPALAVVTRHCDSLLYAADLHNGEYYVRSILADHHSSKPNDSVAAYCEYMLGVFTLEQAEYGEAEEALERAIAANTRLYSAHHPIVASAWSRLARLYSEQGRYRDAVRATNEQVSAYRVELGADNKFTALATLASAEYALRSGNAQEAENLASGLSATIMSGFGNGSTESIRIQRFAGDIAFEKGRYHNAERIYSTALELLSAANEPRLELRASIRLARARTRAIASDPDSAEPDIRACENDLMRTGDRSYGTRALSQLVDGSICELQNRPNAAFAAYNRALSIYEDAAQVNFSYTSERERLEFLREIYRTSGRVFSTAVRTGSIYPAGSAVAYDWLLFEKAAAVTSLAANRESLSRSGDTTASSLIAHIAILAARRSALRSGDSLLIAKPLFGSDSLDVAIERLQKQLVRRSARAGKALQFPRVSWNNVRDRLQPESVAIEIARFPYFDGERQTDTATYAAFVVSPHDSIAPQSTVIGDATTLEDPAMLRAYYLALVPGTKHREALKIVSKLIWAPIAELLPHVGTVYISPDGIYSQLSLPMLPIDDRTQVIDRYEIATLTNTGDVARDVPSQRTQSITIFADPAYGNVRTSVVSALPTAREKGMLQELNATKSEASNIGAIFRGAHWDVQSFLGSDASEQNLDRLRDRSIVHIATHATFRPDSSEGNTITDDLLECALYLSGANKTLRRGSDDPSNDGVVSGLEAMYLDLYGTDLVTLSACESGRGTIEPGEGVFGFPRALRTAGARNVLMSLWRIPDRETAELMTIFYKRLLQGDSKPAALRAAQLKMRSVVHKRMGNDEPLYWAGFELIGY